MGIDVTKDAERVPLEKRRAIARAEGGKLFDVNAALGRKRTIATRVVDPTVVMDRAVTRASKEADKAEAALARELARAEKARKRAAALAEKRRAAVVPTKKRKGAAPKYPQPNTANHVRHPLRRSVRMAGSCSASGGRRQQA
jgi:hypothetical protein